MTVSTGAVVRGGRGMRNERLLAFIAGCIIMAAVLSLVALIIWIATTFSAPIVVATSAILLILTCGAVFAIAEG